MIDKFDLKAHKRYEHKAKVLKAEHEIEQIKKYVEYLEKEVELNLPTQLFESASNAIMEHAKNLKEIANDAMYLEEHGLG